MAVNITYPFSLSGEVKPYGGNGRKLGYPTANIEAEVNAPEGVFVGLTHLGGHKLPSIIFIGIPETFGDTLKRAEAHILDLEDKDLYGEHITIEAAAKLRDNHKFASVEKLIEAMQEDEAQARHFFMENAIIDSVL